MSFRKGLVMTTTASVLIGLVLVYFLNSHQLRFNQGQTQTPSPSSHFLPATASVKFPPLDQNSNLLDETKKLTPEDFSLDFNGLKNIAKDI